MQKTIGILEGCGVAAIAALGDVVGNTRSDDARKTCHKALRLIA